MKVEFEMNLKNGDGSDKKRKREIVRGKGKLIKEYEHFYLIQKSTKTRGNEYRICINKCDIAYGDAKIKFLKEA
ncbi:hypothetical protein BVF91_12995 [Thermoanaerobacterium sp. PSU-2]|uniref:hypothetical protein n=1 Tax=Thermoanaerobacterium sp. PSU-2 TaxID=1930849 RepID=UPI000A163EAB|nr:hypothetical protein [Thermoanaerobacterium sp. PSU-2]ORX22203.1 hypothetical protein BVF91_12995 [Thermoanaerobacterium sp. PSU-2]